MAMLSTITSNASRYDWATWLMGILRSLLSGGSSAMVSGFASMGIAPGTFNLTSSIGNTFKLMGIMFLFQGLYRMFEFLQLHGAPDPVALQAKLDGLQLGGVAGILAEFGAGDLPIVLKGRVSGE